MVTTRGYSSTFLPYLPCLQFCEKTGGKVSAQDKDFIKNHSLFFIKTQDPITVLISNTAYLNTYHSTQQINTFTSTPPTFSFCWFGSAPFTLTDCELETLELSLFAIRGHEGQWKAYSSEQSAQRVWSCLLMWLAELWDVGPIKTSPLRWPIRKPIGLVNHLSMNLSRNMKVWGSMKLLPLRYWLFCSSVHMCHRKIGKILTKSNVQVAKYLPQ